MLDSGVHDFLGQELNVGDVIVYPTRPRGRLAKAEIVAQRRHLRRLRVRLGDDSMGLPLAAQCVRVEKRSHPTVDLASDHS